MCGNVDYVMSMCYSMPCEWMSMSMSYFETLWALGILAQQSGAVG